MRNFTKTLSVAAIAALSLFSATAFAGGASAEVAPPAAVDTAPAAGGTIYGGTTQSVDPTRYDYVPASTPGGGMSTYGATGYASIGGFTFDYNGVAIGIPGFVLQHVINGSGLTIQEEVANYTFGVSAQLCNYQTAFQNRSGNTIYSTKWASYHAGCSYGFAIGQKVSGPFNVKGGAQCARLYVNGSFKGEQCHNVY